MAVYTEVSDEALAAFLGGYAIGSALACKGIAEGVENSNFLLITTGGAQGGGQFVLTLYEKRVDPADLPYFLGLMQHLAGKGLAVPLPVADAAGRLLGELCGRPAAITTFLPGQWPRRPRPEHMAPLGAALARLHLAGADFAGTRANALGPPGWDPLFRRAEPRADEVFAGLAADVRSELDAILAAWPEDLPRGEIHADLFPDNVFFLDGKLSGLIDFYFACTDFLAYDLAVCLNAWCFEPDFGFNVTKARTLLGAYAAVRPLAAEERAALPLLCRGAALRFLLTRLYDWLNTPPGALVTRKDPLEYHRKSRFFRAVGNETSLGL
jgi:homoserine kinase type II